MGLLAAEINAVETTVAEIVEYWSRHQSECGLSVDWAEAEKLCWRCAHKRQLQRCHIVPRALGGSEEAANPVLLCRQCHAEAPNVADADALLAQVRQAMQKHIGRTNTHWGQGKLNAATVAWLLRKVEQEVLGAARYAPK